MKKCIYILIITLSTGIFTYADNAPSTKCTKDEFGMVYTLFTIEAALKGKMNHKAVTQLMTNPEMQTMKQPSQLCSKIQKVSSTVGISFEKLLSRAQKSLSKNASTLKRAREEQTKKEKQNKYCSVDDAVKLYYKQDTLRNQFTSLREAWEKRYSKQINAAIQHKQMQDMVLVKKKEVSAASKHFFATFKKEVKIHITDTSNYDLACDNYKKLEKKYTEILAKLQIDYDTFYKTKSVSNNKTSLSNQNSSDKNITTLNTNDYDAVANKKYNYFVQIINHITPNIRHTFSQYVQECGNDKKKRVRARVEAALKISGGVNRKEYEEMYGYHFGSPYSQEEIDKTLHLFDEIISIQRFKYTDDMIKKFKTYVAEYMKLYTEDAEYFSMKDYIDDNFKKANALHAPIISAFENIIQSDIALRKIANDISDKQALHKIETFKKNNQMLYYYVEKSQYLSKKFFEFANHKKNYIELDAKIVRKRHNALRAHYEEFKKYRQTNKTLFKDNTQYIEYLKRFKSYVGVSKEFYIRVKSKKRESASEKEISQYIPAVAKYNMEANKDGSLLKLLNTYNTLVSDYNSLN